MPYLRKELLAKLLPFAGAMQVVESKHVSGKQGSSKFAGEGVLDTFGGHLLIHQGNGTRRPTVQGKNLCRAARTHSNLGKGTFLRGAFTVAVEKEFRFKSGDFTLGWKNHVQAEFTSPRNTGP